MPAMEFFLSMGMLLTGALNTLSIKYQVRPRLVDHLPRGGLRPSAAH